MSRPRKDSGLPEARQRLIDAFWELLQENYFHKITVGAVAERAGCNRGTFYYHFSDMEELAAFAIEYELMGENSIASTTFQLIMDVDTDEVLCDPELFDRIWLLMGKGGSTMVEGKVKEIVSDVWRAVLCDGDDDLEVGTYLILEYAVSGLLGMLRYLGNSETGEHGAFPASIDSDFFHGNTQFLIGRISETQNIPYEEIVDRFATVSRLTNVPLLQLREQPYRRYA